MKQNLTVEQADVRIDRYISEHLPEHSRSYIQKLIEQGCVLQNGETVRASTKTLLQAEISIEFPEPEPSILIPEAIPLDIRYEDEWLLVVNKPQGMVVHPAVGHHAGTLVHALLAYCGNDLSDINGVVRPGIVHRIDKDTSGLLLVVKDNRVHASMAEKIRRHEVTRVYYTIVHGIMEAASGSIDAPIGRDPKNRQRMAVVPGGKPSVTHFKLLEQFRQAAYLEAALESGRTHQIRVHLRYIGHPVVGDPVYATGRKTYGATGQALHAGRLSFSHPVTGKQVTVEAPPPETFCQLLEQFR
ncbi:MAG: RluA family pseudouridine synthase [Saccharofermentanales bacterium]|jgi:23S rRNA pseudouridine1911/1915/1917 synthase